VDAVEGELTPVDRCRFGWTPPDDWEGGMARVAALADRLPVVDWAGVLANLNRRTRGTGATHRTAIPQLADGFTWNAGDDNVDYWMPQGITGSSDAAAGGLVAGRRLLLVSWYHKDAEGGGPQRGVRVSVVDWNLVGRAVDDYRHLLLVEPTVGPDGVPDFRAVEIHAGGIAWVGRWLFVADTRHGLRVFDMERVMEVATGEDRMGRQGDRWYARGYRYVIPQVARYDVVSEPRGCPVRFSFVALDRSTDPLSLVTGEYHADDRRARVLRWHLDPETDLPWAPPGGVAPVEAYLAGRTKVQGAVSWNGAWYLSCSSQWTRFGRLYRTGTGFDGGWLAWAYGAEDLYHERDRGLLWTPAEHPGTRDVVAVPRASFE